MVLCPKCGNENPPAGKFCQECGTSLAPAPTAAPPKHPKQKRSSRAGNIALAVIGLIIGIVIIMLPGPPRELEGMFEAECLSRLARLVPAQCLRSRVYKAVGLAESEVDQRIAPIYKTYSNPSTTILATPGAIEVHLRARAASEAEADSLLTELGEKIEAALGDHLFTSRGESLEEVVGMCLVLRRKTLAVAESCTGGLLAERLTRVPGS